ncbi:MAG: hypothetical protein BroJett040_05310 [Oligoflexia bacterium]|nr:MAG: hypothetical protein BroJett040_05310 [Oligoflexia bacterium]
MLRIINLLNQKNHYLEKFYTLNETELLNFSKANFDNLENFYQTREKLLEIIRYLDSEIDACQSEAAVAVTAELRRDMKEALAIKDEYVNRILAQDLEVLSCIEVEKSNIIKELQEIRNNKKAISSYKSPTFTKRLDEEV